MFTQNTYQYLLLLLGMSFLFSSCATYKAKYKNSWTYIDQIEDPYLTLYLIGDGGNAPMGESTPVLEHLKNELETASENSAIVWLGDNIYPVGLAPKQSPYYPQGHHRLSVQMETMQSFDGQKFIVPGNHDWYSFGRIGLRRQEMLIDSLLSTYNNPLNQSNFFVPDKGCGDPQKIQLKEGVSLLVMDSHWFLNDKINKLDNSHCKVKSREQYLEEIKNITDKTEDETLIVCSHHPPFTYGGHGGSFSFKEYFFPLTQVVDWLFIPMPVTGVAFNKLRTIASDQDVNHPNYKMYKEEIPNILKSNGHHLFASGHEHTLQLIEREGMYYIVSGAGSKNNPVKLGKDASFTIGEKGYTKVIFESPKRALIQFIVPGKFEEKNNVAYNQWVDLGSY